MINSLDSSKVLDWFSGPVSFLAALPQALDDFQALSGSLTRVLGFSTFSDSVQMPCSGL